MHCSPCVVGLGEVTWREGCTRYLHVTAIPYSKNGSDDSRTGGEKTGIRMCDDDDDKRQHSSSFFFFSSSSYVGVFTEMEMIEGSTGRKEESFYIERASNISLYRRSR